MIFFVHLAWYDFLFFVHLAWYDFFFIAFLYRIGFTSDVKLWEVEFSKSGEFHKVCSFISSAIIIIITRTYCSAQVSKAMDLKGHHASVLDISFSGDSHRWV